MLCYSNGTDKNQYMQYTDQFIRRIIAHADYSRVNKALEASVIL